MNDTPVFVVVGDVNQGKSSVVSALSEDEGIVVSRTPGTTTRSGAFTFLAEGREVFRLVDTPGFHEARAVLAWMRERAASPAERPAAVAAFVDAHRGGDRFEDEVELLTPILAGAGILYVVDGSRRFQPADEAEMEILRWTGQPGMALVNRIRADRDHGDEWRSVLEQYFNIVRDFDAHGATFEDRAGLLRGFREIRAAWREPLDRAVDALERDWRERRRRVAAALADLMADVLGHVELQRIGEHDDVEAARARLDERYHDALREREASARADVERVHRHNNATEAGAPPALVTADLFDEETWRLGGLTRSQLAVQGLKWGAALGAGVDLMVGGASFLLGAAAGALAGGVGGWFAPEGAARVGASWGEDSRFARMFSWTGLVPEAGRFLAVGPVQNPQFAWILLDRALLHYRLVRDRSHARRDKTVVDAPAPDGRQGVVAVLGDERRAALGEVFRAALKDAARARHRGSGDALVSADVRRRLADTLDDVLGEL